MSLFHNRESMARSLNLWNAMTYGEARAKMVTTEKNKDILVLLDIVLKHQNLEDKPMNGYSSQDLDICEIEKMGKPYASYFNDLEEGDAFWTPCDILYKVCENNLSRRAFYEKKAAGNKMSFDQLTWVMCGRALRALPSFIREHQLANAMKHAFPKARFEQNEKLDLENHCDIKMVLNDKTYHVWSFVLSKWGIVSFCQKFNNSRYGKVPNGEHLICAFDRYREATLYHGWLFYSKRYIDEIKTAIYQREALDYGDVLKGPIYFNSFYIRPVVVNKHDSIQPVQAVIPN